MPDVLQHGILYRSSYTDIKIRIYASRSSHTPRASRSNPGGRQFDSAKVLISQSWSFFFLLPLFFLLNYTNGLYWNCCLHHVCNEKCWHSQYNNHPWKKHFARKHWTWYLNALPNNTQKITRKRGKSYLFSTRRRAFNICGMEHEEKCNVAKRFTVDIFTERDRKWSLVSKVVVESAGYTIYIFDTKSSKQ